MKKIRRICFIHWRPLSTQRLSVGYRVPRVRLLLISLSLSLILCYLNSLFSFGFSSLKNIHLNLIFLPVRCIEFNIKLFIISIILKYVFALYLLKFYFRKMKFNFRRMKFNFRKVKFDFRKMKFNFRKVKSNSRKMKLNFTKMKLNFRKMKMKFRKMELNSR